VSPGAQEKVALVVARQAGAANAFAPLLDHLAAVRPACPVTALALPPADAAWQDRVGRFHRVSDFAGAAPWLGARRGAAFLLTGTSHAVADDGRFWAWAAHHGVPSVAFVDQWVNYWQRFTRRARFDTLPARIAVVDAVAHRRMLEAGCPAERLAITGNPAFDGLAPVTPAAGARARTALGVPPGHRLVAVVADPLGSREEEAAFRTVNGFSTRDALAVLLGALDGLARRLGPLHCLVKPHPVEGPAAVSSLLGNRPSSRDVHIALTEADRRQLVAAADLVAGMRSVLLYEATLLGRPAVSVQPHRTTACDATDDRPGLLLATEPDDLSARLAHHMTTPPPRVRPEIPDSCATLLRLCTTGT
jgi:hypothetical protein